MTSPRLTFEIPIKTRKASTLPCDAPTRMTGRVILRHGRTLSVADEDRRVVTHQRETHMLVVQEGQGPIQGPFRVLDRRDVLLVGRDPHRSELRHAFAPKPS